MVKHVLKVALGILLVLIGIIGGLIPIFQGWVFGIPGLMLLGSVFPSIKRFTKKYVKKAKKTLKN